MKMRIKTINDYIEENKNYMVIYLVFFNENYIVGLNEDNLKV